MTDQLIIFDTTLRDGEQSPGAAMTKDEKIRIARQLERLGVDVIEAGFAAASLGDAEAIKSIAGIIKNSTVCSLARANERDVRAAGEAITPCRLGAHPYLHRHQPPSTWRRSCACSRTRWWRLRSRR
jgi:2-isopropylmalate synthase